AALMVPIKASQQVIGVVVLMRKKEVPYQPAQQRLVEAVADFASISLANARLFRTLEERVRLQQVMMENATLRVRVLDQTLRQVRLQMRAGIERQRQALESLSKDPTARWSPGQRQALTTWRESLDALRVLAGLIPDGLRDVAVAPAKAQDFNALVGEAVHHLLPLVQQRGQEIILASHPQPLPVNGDEALLGYVLEGVLTLAIGLSESGQIQGRISEQQGEAHLEIELQAKLTDEQRGALQNQPFEGDALISAHIPRGLSPDRHLIQQILKQYQGKIWLEFVAAHSLRWHVVFPLARSSTAIPSSPAKATEIL
ncbi:GAF domain-containing protein, partial [Thermanaerothrix sp.]|uniref:GAF domain-containing protein n=1 Tax=Thermanaerothrix sp. TaxID=2972675 RepID=UPI003C7E0F9A